MAKLKHRTQKEYIKRISTRSGGVVFFTTSNVNEAQKFTIDKIKLLKRKYSILKNYKIV